MVGLVMMTMADSAKKAQIRSRRPRGRSRDEPTYYVLEIKKWEWSFVFGVNAMPERDGPYSDYRHLQLWGNLLRPKRVKAQEVELAFLPRHDLNEGERERHEPKAVGSLQLYRGRLTGLLSIPSDALPPVLQMMIADRFRFAVLQGERLRYGRALIRTYHLDMTIEEDDLPPE
jgi:hypothetical protein